MILPLTTPVPLLTSLLSKSKLVTLPPAVEIVISPLPIVPLRFCWLNVNIISDGSEVLSLALRNENTCDSNEPANNLADVPSSPSAPCRALVKLIVLESDTLAEVAVIVNEPLSCPKALTVTVLPLSDATTPNPLDDEIV